MVGWKYLNFTLRMQIGQVEEVDKLKITPLIKTEFNQVLYHSIAL